MINQAYSLLKTLKSASAMGGSSNSFMPLEPLPNSVKAKQLEEEEMLAEMQNEGGDANSQLTQMQKAQQDAVTKLQESQAKIQQLEGQLQNAQATAQQSASNMQAQAAQQLEAAKMKAEAQIQEEKIKSQRAILSMQEKHTNALNKSPKDQSGILSNQLRRVTDRITKLQKFAREAIDVEFELVSSKSAATVAGHDGVSNDVKKPGGHLIEGVPAQQWFQDQANRTGTSNSYGSVKPQQPGAAPAAPTATTAPTAPAPTAVNPAPAPAAPTAASAPSPTPPIAPAPVASTAPAPAAPLSNGGHADPAAGMFNPTPQNPSTVAATPPPPSTTPTPAAPAAPQAPASTGTELVSAPTPNASQPADPLAAPAPAAPAAPQGPGFWEDPSAYVDKNLNREGIRNSIINADEEDDSLITKGFKGLGRGLLAPLDWGKNFVADTVGAGAGVLSHGAQGIGNAVAGGWNTAKGLGNYAMDGASYLTASGDKERGLVKQRMDQNWNNNMGSALNNLSNLSTHASKGIGNLGTTALNVGSMLIPGIGTAGGMAGRMAMNSIVGGGVNSMFAQNPSMATQAQPPGTSSVAAQAPEAYNPMNMYAAQNGAYPPAYKSGAITAPAPVATPAPVAKPRFGAMNILQTTGGMSPQQWAHPALGVENQQGYGQMGNFVRDLLFGSMGFKLGQPDIPRFQNSLAAAQPSYKTIA